MTSIKDVARKAGVSISTVSHVLNSTKNVSPELMLKVRKAVEELDYSANPSAQSLRNLKSGQIAVIVTSFSRPFFTGVLEGINYAAKKAGYSLLLAETHDNIDAEIKLVSEFVCRGVDGIILASSAYGKDEKTNNYIKSLPYLEKKGMRIPLITLEYAFRGIDLSAVTVDNEGSAYNAVTYLAKNLNRREIAYISLPWAHYLGRVRRRGYERALRELNIPVREDLILEGDYSAHSGYRIMKQLLDSGKRPDGVFCANDQMATGVVLACNESGVLIPDETAIIGNDDIFVSSLVRPSLTSIQVPFYEMGISAMEVLAEEIEDDSIVHRKLTLNTRLVTRGTTEKDYQNNLNKLKW